MGRPAVDVGTKSCAHCGAMFGRRRFGGRLEDIGVFRRRRFCTLRCGWTAKNRDRPAHWATYHFRARKHRKSSCEGCGSTKQLHVHHVDGRPENNDPTNLQTLCVFCHNFLHATAERLGWTIPGRLPELTPQGYPPTWAEPSGPRPPASRSTRGRSRASSTTSDPTAGKP